MSNTNITTVAKTECTKTGKQKKQEAAAVYYSSITYRLDGVGLGSGFTGELGHAWVGAWVSVHGAWVVASRRCMQPSKHHKLQDHSGPGEELSIYVTDSPYENSAPQYAQPSLPVTPYPNWALPKPQRWRKVILAARLFQPMNGKLSTNLLVEIHNNDHFML